MADKMEFDWAGISGSAVEKLRKPKTPPPPPASIVALAQRSWDGVPGPDGEKLHVLRHQFKAEEGKKAEAFGKLLKAAGPYTDPPTSVSVVTDPDETGNTLLYAWRAGVRRGRAASAS